MSRPVPLRRRCRGRCRRQLMSRPVPLRRRRPTPPGLTQPSAASTRRAGPTRGAQGADPGGRHRGAGRRRAAARRRRTRDVRDVGDRHRQVAGRHLQRAARHRRRDRREDGATAYGTGRGHHHRRGREDRADHRGAGHASCASISRPARSTASSAPCGRRSRVPTRTPVFVFHAGGWFDGGLRAAAQAPAAGHPDVRLRARRGLHRGARGRVRAEAAGARRQRAVHPGRLVAGRCAGLRVRDRAQAARAPTCASSGSSTRCAPARRFPQTKEETRARWDRYARFAERTFNVEVPPIPYEQLEELDDEGQVQFVLDAVSQSGVQIPGGIIEHQRTSYLDNRLLDTAEIQPYDGHVTLYMADRYHDDAIFFEPRYATRQARRRLGRVRLRPGGRADRGRAHPGDRRAVHCESRRAYERGDQPRSSARRTTRASDRRSRRSDPPDHRREARRTPREAGAGQGTRRREGRRQAARRRASRAPARASTRCSTRAASWRSARCARRRAIPTRCSATAWSPATAPSTAGRSACSATTRRCSRARSARCSAARSPS